ncbi:MAG TPA: gluconokinase [Intrasporangium sp.]|uniref:gluconokinase n=1 Tax=Intrasporangium sp. TaxID=1925024 RepID=UPI002D766CF9|nr:gluconokinase [Intrasporangium sp.]HET7398899.1 gluconokinase [Intrasporangium sp.]
MAGEGRGSDVVVVMGVSGCGKSTVARGIADAMGWQLAEGDDFHPEANVEKMRRGEPLTDEDRWPWLRLIGQWIDARRERGEPTVVTCSALRRRYRELLREGRPQVRFCHVTAPDEVIRARLSRRTGHYMPSSLLESQLRLLEPLGSDEPGVTVSAEGSTEEVIARALDALGLRGRAPG